MLQIIARRTSFFQSITNMIYIHFMNLNSLDLNLLVALDALLREANVSRAAMRIGLSQPAASHALQRLRDLIGDPLLVRAGARLERRDVFLDARHVAVVIRGQSDDLIDVWLRAKGTERRIALVVPGYIEALHVAARTDLVAFVPRRLIGALSKQLSLATVAPPLDPGIDEQFMFYPTRAQMDPGSIWLRNIMLGIGREMERGKRAA